MKKLFFYLACTFCSVVAAQVYRGTIDKYPIVFEIINDEYSDFDARYFYTKVRKDIFLKRKNKNTFIFSDQQGKETFTLEGNSQSLSGTWASGDKKLAVQLTKVDPATLKNSYQSKELETMKTEETYSFLKTENITLTKVKEEAWDKWTIIEWMKEPVSGMEFPRIKSSQKIKNIDALNKLLTEKHMEQIASYFSCISGSRTVPGEYSFSCSVAFISDQLISVRNNASYYCGGAHPDFSSWGLTIDHVNMKELHLSDLYWFDDKKKYNSNTSKNQDDNMSQFGQIWNELVKKHFPEEMKPKAGDDCSYNDPEIWSSYSWLLTPEGLLIGSYFARVMRACDTFDNWPVISYKDLDNYRVNKEKYKLE
jgi:hypothetical protein